jgi:hypothetical protein
LENWYDLLAFLSRPQLGQVASHIGNRRFASILQGFLHKYLQQITLPPINISKTTNEDANDPPKAIVNLWHSKKWGTEELPLADWPMPENITNFESIKLRFVRYYNCLSPCFFCLIKNTPKMSEFIIAIAS